MLADTEGHTLRVAVVGAGAFGRNHLRVYSELRDSHNVQVCAVVDPDPAALAAAAGRYGVPEFATVTECLASVGAAGIRLDAASVCVPTMHHAAVAEELLTAGIDLLIEKPIAASLAEADRICTLAEEHGRVVQVGHLERFNPAVTAAREHLNRPMFFEAHRLSVFTLRSLDVDVVLDLMIHDLDIVLSLVASPVREVRAVGLPVLSQKVDIANVRVEFENGCIANFTASRVSTERVRKLRFFQPHQYLSLDFARQDLLLIDVAGLQTTAVGGGDSGSSGASAHLRRDEAAPKMGHPFSSMQDAAMQSGAHPSPGLSLRKVPVVQGEPLRLEIAAFLDAVRTRSTPVVSAVDGRAALKLALEITEAIALHAKRAGITG
jgi:predicted dehydrogenase